MNKLTATNKVIVAVVVVLVAGLLLWKFNGPAPQSPAAPEANAPANGGTNPGSTGGTMNTTPGTGATAPKTGGTTASPSQSAILFVTPVPGDTWKLMTSNPIQWSRAANTTGQIELLDAATKAYVGEILNETGVGQTSYAWNTRDINLSRTNPAKKNVAPGRYVIRIEFDSLHLPPITSQPFTIVAQ